MEMNRIMMGGKMYPIAMVAVLVLAVGCKSQRAVGLTKIPAGDSKVGDPGSGDPRGGSGGGGNNGNGLGNGNTGTGGGTGVTTNDNNNPNPNPNPVDDRNRDLNKRPGNYVEDRVMLAAQAVHFDYDSAEVRPTDTVRMELVARYLNAQPTFYLLVEGHCDERGTEQYNLTLGQRRAQSVRDALMKFGISPERVQTISYGEKVPVIASSDDVSYEENRRGEFVVYRPTEATSPAPTPVIVP